MLGKKRPEQTFEDFGEWEEYRSYGSRSPSPAPLLSKIYQPERQVRFATKYDNPRSRSTSPTAARKTPTFLPDLSKYVKNRSSSTETSNRGWSQSPPPRTPSPGLRSSSSLSYGSSSARYSSGDSLDRVGVNGSNVKKTTRPVRKNNNVAWPSPSPSPEPEFFSSKKFARKNPPQGEMEYVPEIWKPSRQKDFELGDRVIVKSNQGDAKTGILRYLGTVDFADGIWAGIELFYKHGRNDGTVLGKEYFRCEYPYGLFVPSYRVSHSPANRLEKKTMGVRDNFYIVPSEMERFVRAGSYEPYA